MKKAEWEKMRTSLKETLEPPAPRSERKNQSRTLVNEFAVEQVEPEVAVPTQPIPTHPNPSQNSSTAPTKDFNKRANSLERDALPRGLFPGTSKKLYDALYLRTRGAISPKRTIQATKRELLLWSGIKSKNTIAVNLQLLTSTGLIKKEVAIGDHEGSTYEILLPDEIPSPTLPNSSQPNPTQKLGGDPTQLLGWDGMGNAVESKREAGIPNTSSKTTTNDDEAFATLNKKFKELSVRVTGKAPQAGDAGRWGELAELISAEAERAAAHTSVSNLPAFLTEHLRRRFSQPERKERGSGQSKIRSAVEGGDVNVRREERRLTPEEISEFVATASDLLSDGRTLEQVTEQFAPSLHPEDWSAIEREITNK